MVPGVVAPEIGDTAPVLSFSCCVVRLSRDALADADAPSGVALAETISIMSRFWLFTIAATEASSAAGIWLSTTSWAWLAGTVGTRSTASVAAIETVGLPSASTATWPVVRVATLSTERSKIELSEDAERRRAAEDTTIGEPAPILDAAGLCDTLDAAARPADPGLPTLARLLGRGFSGVLSDGMLIAILSAAAVSSV